MSDWMLPIERTRPFDLGVLLVHGIGQQRKGETLSTIGEPLTEGLQRYLARLSAAVPTAARRACRVELTSVRMNEDSDLPAHAEMTLHGVERLRRDRTPHDGPATRWLLAESWWAESFPQPTYRQILQWLVGTFPITMVSHFDRRLRRAWFEIRNPDNQANRSGKYFRLVRAWISLLLGIVVLPPALCLLVMMLFVGLLPIPFMGQVAQWVQRLLAATVGDSYILLSNRVARASITQKVHSDLAWLSRRCERVVVVAHSQGGAIAHDVFRHKPLIECEHLITYGSGLQKLALIEQMKDSSSRGMHLLLWSAIIGFFAASVSTLTRSFAPALVQAWLAWVGAAVGLAALVALAAWMRRSRRFFSFEKQWEADQALFNKRFRLPCENRVFWGDIIASDDPVPNGPLLDQYHPQQLKLRVVSNLGSLLRDHTTYWESSDDFVSRVVYKLLSLSGVDPQALDPDADHRQHAASLRRRWRVAWRRAGGLTALVTSIAIALSLWFAPPEVASRAMGDLTARFAATFPVAAWIAAPASRPFHTPLAVLLFAGAFLVLAAIFNRIWAIWNQSEMAILFEPRRDVRKPPPCYELWDPFFVFYLFALVLAWTSGALFALRLSIPPAGVLLSALFALAVLLAIRWIERTGRSSWMRSVAGRAAAGPLDALRTRWETLDQRYLENAAKKRSPWSTYLVGERQIESSSDEERANGAETLRKAIALGSPDAAWRLGEYLEKPLDTDPDIDGARDAYEAGMRLGDSRCAHWLGLLHERHLGDLDTAVLIYWYSAFELDEPLSAHSLGILMELRSGGRRTAIKAFEKGSELRDSFSCRLLGDLLCRCAEERRRRGQQRSADVLVQAAAARYQEAILLGEHRAATTLGKLRLDLGDTQGALEAFQAGMRLRSPTSALELGRLLVAQGRPAEATDAFRRVIELWQVGKGKNPADSTSDSASVEASWELGQLLEAHGQPETAERLYRFAVGLAPAGAEGRQPAAMGGLLERLGRVTEAETAYRRAAEWSSEAELGLVRLLSFQRNLSTAKEVAREHAWWQSPQAGLQLARLLLEGDDKKAAREVVDRLSIFHGSPAIALESGRLLEAAGDADGARIRYREAMERGSCLAAKRLGRLLKKSGDDEGAHQAFSQARILAAIQEQT